MYRDNHSSYGPKLDRLLRIRAIDSLAGLVPPIFPVAALPLVVTDDTAPMVKIESAYAASLAQAFPRLRQEVAQVCGPAPWIVRSAGIEDFTDHVNAGGYESLICFAPEDLLQQIATVALSGLTEHARRQLTLSGRATRFEAVSCFVQPLLKIDVAGDVDLDHSPYLDSAVLDQLEAVCAELMEAFEFSAIDCEWGLDTALGFVSITTVMPRDRRVMNVAHTLGFGFASAQSVGSRATTLVLRPASADIRLWRGRHLRETQVRRLHLLQARPAHFDAAFRERAALTDDCYEALSRHYDVVDGELLLLGAKSFGRALAAPDLMSAWRQYLGLDAREQAEVAIVLVDEGSAEEHAGIMFRQQKITCVKADTPRVPASADCAAYDRGTCILGDSTMLRSIRTAVRRELVLPDGCAAVFTDEVLTAKGELAAHCTETLSELNRLPLAREAKERLLARTEQPMASLWMQRVDDTVESPSLLAQIGRSRYPSPGYAGELCARTGFARAYARAIQISRGESRLELPTLFALSSAVRLLVKSGDLRLIIALLDCEEASSWVRPPTLACLIDSAARQLIEHQRDSAVLVLGSVSLVSAECTRLPFYEAAEMASYIDALAHAYERGLSARSLTPLHSLGLPIPSVAQLVPLALTHRTVLESLEAFQHAMVSFRGIAFGADAVAQLSEQVNDAHASLQSALCEVGMGNVAEQLKGALIEAYDASLKGLLARAVERGDADCYRRYLLVMQQWIAHLRKGSLSLRDDVVLLRFQGWMHEWLDEEMPRSFEIEDRNWRAEFDTVAAAREAALRYENPHVLHNLLHQWSLASLCLETRSLPKRVQAVERFCSTFSSRATKVLRFERELLEIQIPMGTHKASYVFTPRQITVEWTEPPDCSGGEIARVLAFEVFLERIRRWMFPELVIRREQVLGTWTLFIRLGAPAAGLWQHEDLTRFVAATRFLFDASYDFSYVENGAIDGFAQRFNGPAWKSVVAALVQYRTVLDDASQYVALHTLPMSSTVSAIAQSRVVRGLILHCLLGGVGRCWSLIDRYAHWLANCAQDDARWGDRYECLRQASLFLAANWPRQALARLVGRNGFHIGHDLVAACLCKRSDLKGELQEIAAASGATLSGVYALIVRHAPEVAVAHCGAAPLFALLVDTGARFRRAKHFLTAHFADQIEQSLLGRLLQGMDTVPWGHSVAAEQAIQAHISTRESICRFRLERGVDWTMLDSWTRTRTSCP